MAFSAKQLKRYYNDYNTRWFGGHLPTNTEVWWEPVDGAIAIVDVDGCGLSFDETSDTFMIRINPAIAWSSRQTRMAVLHEMAHMAIYPSPGHGVKFQKTMQLLARAGALSTLW